MGTSPTPSDDVFVVRRSAPLSGTIRVPGAKNSVLKLMAASILAPGETVLSNVPAIADVPVMADILRGLGADVDLDLAGGVCTIVFDDEPDWHAPADAVSRIRASISCLGPLVGRVRRCRIALPGGDDIGKRGIEMHLEGLEAMGATVVQHADGVEVRAEELHGAQITLDFPSVGATENLVMAATVAEGRTIIDNAAREPEIQDLCGFLVEMGARIEGAGDPRIEVEGVPGLTAVSWRTCPDRIEAGTWAVAAALTRGDLLLENVRPGDLTMPLMKLRAAGAVVEEGADTLRVKAEDLEPVNFVTLPYPGFPTDMQPQFMVLLSQAQGTSMCTENVFESRFSFVEQFRKMGADIEIDGHHALIRGVSPLRGAVLDGLDVRAGAAGVLAGLVAEGETIVRDVHHVDRGYADVVPRLRSVGADVERVPASDVELPASDA
ncbi:MAG: UDP-N-acetylglucosamine 1-carboxyvinyltransferase [Actinobacteria bacterium]|nr:UDP-N-acetylglucosamine 1-carboxyvinyltransferase [Actinomycetota bacterium]